MDGEFWLDRCRVCGWPEDFLPWGQDGRSPTWDICPCCGVEYGYEDGIVASVWTFRERWLARGAPFRWPKDKPPGWDLEEQMKHVPPEFR